MTKTRRLSIQLHIRDGQKGRITLSQEITAKMYVDFFIKASGAFEFLAHIRWTRLFTDFKDVDKRKYYAYCEKMSTGISMLRRKKNSSKHQLIYLMITVSRVIDITVQTCINEQMLMIASRHN